MKGRIDRRKRREKDRKGKRRAKDRKGKRRGKTEEKEDRGEEGLKMWRRIFEY